MGKNYESFSILARISYIFIIIGDFGDIPKTDKKLRTGKKLFVLALISIICIIFLNMQIRKFAIQTNG